MTASSTSQLEGMKADLKCPVCLEIKKGPIFQCQVGSHIICLRCYSCLVAKKCPVCKGTYSRPPSRNTFAERLIGNLHLTEVQGEDGSRLR
jgi:hypothetical protein